MDAELMLGELSSQFNMSRAQVLCIPSSVLLPGMTLHEKQASRDLGS